MVFAVLYYERLAKLEAHELDPEQSFFSGVSEHFRPLICAGGSK
jgi:hypothetical protein